MISKKIYTIALAGLVSATALAGNKDRSGSAGASELLINPWARSSGWASAGMSSVKGLEATFVNVAGLAFTSKTELQFSNSQWLVPSGVTINNVGFAQRVGETSVIGLTMMNMNIGDIPYSVESNPEGDLGSFTPKYNILGLSFAKEFSNSIYGGITVKAISEAISNVKASGVAIDAGIRYVTGENDQIKFGIALKNVGPTMTFKGDGLSYTFEQEFQGITNPISVEQRSAAFELPSLVSIGASYDFLFGETQVLTLAGGFISNSFTKDQFSGGAEYTFTADKAEFSLRGGYIYEGGELSRAHSGLSGGLSIGLLFGENKSGASLDYSFRPASNFAGTHCVGIRLNLQ